MIGDTVAGIIGYAILIFTFTYKPIFEEIGLWAKVIAIVCFGVLPTLGIIGLTIRGFYSVIKIDEKGVSRALFGIFFKKEISWEEMKGMWALYQVQVFVFFSKSVSLDGMTYNKIIKQKDGVDDDTAKRLYLE
ncbi:MAG: hypothetical protein HFE48_02915 [Clostridia bacterium]|nr:hypothetical protein [Clostridia bacterium]